ncbi:hypothetical protein IU443_24045 [Nocardia farcinica]|uniref:hypothetical protein n=1 Tax=Nocardia TaxID=1817 RepID=UPI001485B8FF|nr:MULTISPECIES: hypothetical protein [Nocardia]MBF6254496.1 hypothetical protein [Nocardia farcinica]MBF6265280.1 hypothetical protein [Nocardia farcinica]MBF6283903.1 hypothetical protein [Nocardia farcinica]MBF6294538.1 hypothetical protein [Nocardia farcinica]MBF6308612.1 hypothetical protein [Nocardia farcinica]
MLVATPPERVAEVVDVLTDGVATIAAARPDPHPPDRLDRDRSQLVATEDTHRPSLPR